MTTTKATGTVWAIFGHRFAVEGAEGRLLADLGPKGGEGLAIAVGDTVSVEGERKPTEIKVAHLTTADGTVHAIAWPRKDAAADPGAAVAAAMAAGYRVTGEPERKPKHFELAAEKDGAAVRLHVAFDGTLRAAKPGKEKAVAAEAA